MVLVRCLWNVRCAFSEVLLQPKYSYFNNLLYSSSTNSNELYDGLCEEIAENSKKRNNFLSKFGKTSGETHISSVKRDHRPQWKRQTILSHNVTKDELSSVDSESSKNIHNVSEDAYVENRMVTQRTQEEVDEWLVKHEVTIKGEKLPRPVYTFKEAGFQSEIVKMLESKFDKPTLTQSVSWPIALSHRDMISVAQTGSGKTLAFALPGIIHSSKVRSKKKTRGPSFTILTPTRELAQQVEQVLRTFCVPLGLKSLCIFGGSSRYNQAMSLERSVDVVVATPGRLNDFLDDGVTSLDQCGYLVLDEADRMLDMGFEPQIRRIIERIRCTRQTLMFSATWPKEVQLLANDFLNQPVFVNIGSLKLAANPNIRQVVKIIEPHRKRIEFMNLMDELTEKEGVKILVFAETKYSVDLLTRWLRHDGWPALSLHGDKSQSQRDLVLRSFKSGRAPVLIATDVAARGLDVDDITHVVNYDFPLDIEVYVHRIGRTARHERSGTSISFFTESNAKRASELIHIMERAGQTVPDELRNMVSRNFEQNSKRNSFRPSEFSNGTRWPSKFKQFYGSEKQNNYRHFE